MSVTRNISLPLSVMTWIQEESENTGMPTAKILLTLVRIGISEKMHEAAREREACKDTIIPTREVQINDCIPEKESAEIDRLLSAKTTEE